MSDLYRRILLWHKLVAMQTGGLALCSARHKLNRAEALGWAASFRNVADDIDAFLTTGAFILDDKGQRVVHSDDERAGPEPQEVRHVTSPTVPKVHSAATAPKVGGRRIAARKKL